MNLNLPFLPAAVLALSFMLPHSHATPPRLKLVPIVENAFASPVAIANAHDGSGRLFVVDQRGTIHIITGDGELIPEPFLDISAKLVSERQNFDERGLLSMAFHSDVQPGAALGSGRFYVYYSAPSENSPGTAENPVDHKSVVAEYLVSAEDENKADPDSERILLTFDQPQFNHDGGQLAFNDSGLLYISTGDGGGSNDNDAGHTGGSQDQPDGGLGNSQDLTKLLGKILRIDPLGTSAPGGQYSIPENNPFTALDDGTRHEIFAYGLRNPWRFSFDRQTGEIYCADVGQGEVEEVNLIEPGKNYGWRRFEGTFDFDPTAPTTGNTFEPPIGQYAHSNAVIPGLLSIGNSVTGGFVYRGSEIPDLVGTYVFGDWTASFRNPSGTMLALEPDGDGTFEFSVLDIEGGNPIGYYLPAFGEDESGELYVAGKTTLAPSAVDAATGSLTGAIFKIAPIPTLPPSSDSASLEPGSDTSIYEEGNLANGAGQHLFSGHTVDGNERRALLKFDIASAIPIGSTIDAATLTMRVNKVPRGAVSSDFGLHTIGQDWSPGTVDAVGQEGMGGTATNGSATWISTSLATGPDWIAAGGDFNPTASASTDIGTGTGSRQWTSEQLAQNVQSWLDAPVGNFGWLLLSNDTAPATARRLSASEGTIATNRPTLQIDYTFPGGPITHLDAWLAKFYPGGNFPGDLSDDDNDHRNALLEYGFATDPTAADDASRLPTGVIDLSTGDFAFTFIRDPRASDLTYTVQSSSDLNTWADIATSMAGRPTTGSTATESIVLTNYPLRSVTITLSDAANELPRQHLRLMISRE